MRPTRNHLVKRLNFEELEPRTLLSASSFFSSTAGYGGGVGGILAPGTGTSFEAGTSGTPIGAEFGDVDAGGFGPAQGFGSGFGIPGGSAEAGPSGFGPVGSGGLGTAASFAGGIGTPGTLAAEIGLGPLAIEGGGLPVAGMAFGALADVGGVSAAARDDSGVGQMTITTGANTLGIRSFATPTSGYSSGFTGAGGPIIGGGGEDESAPDMGPDGGDTSSSLIPEIQSQLADVELQPLNGPEAVIVRPAGLDAEIVTIVSK